MGRAGHASAPELLPEGKRRADFLARVAIPDRVVVDDGCATIRNEVGEAPQLGRHLGVCRQETRLDRKPMDLAIGNGIGRDAPVEHAVRVRDMTARFHADQMLSRQAVAPKAR